MPNRPRDSTPRERVELFVGIAAGPYGIPPRLALMAILVTFIVFVVQAYVQG